MIPPAGAVARSRNLGQTFLANSVQGYVKIILLNLRSSVRAEHGSWSWKPYTYRKKQVCDSEARFIRPGYAQDSTGKWQVIVQTDTMPQRVAIDLCRTPGRPCE